MRKHERNSLAMEVLTKGPILDWTSDGKLHERFLEWKKKVSVLCKGLKMTKADPEFTCLNVYLPVVRRARSKYSRQGDVCRS